MVLLVYGEIRNIHAIRVRAQKLLLNVDTDAMTWWYIITQLYNGRSDYLRSINSRTSLIT